MNIAPVSFRGTYKLTQNQNYAKVEKALFGMKHNLKALSGQRYSYDLARHSNGSFYLLTEGEADTCKKIKNAPISPEEDNLALSGSRKVSIYGSKRQEQIDRLIDATYDGKDVDIKYGLVEIV